MMRPLTVTVFLFVSHFALAVIAEGLLKPEVSTKTEEQEEDSKYWRELLDSEENMSVPTAAPAPAPSKSPIESPSASPLTPPTKPPTPEPLTPSLTRSPTVIPTSGPTTAPIPSPTRQPSTPPPVPQDGDDACSPSNLQALEDAKQQWDESGIVSYKYVFDQICFCFPPGPIEIEVANCTIENATFLIEEFEDEDATERASTIEQLFAGLEQSLARCPDNGPDSYQVSFHPELGYPLNVNIDREFAAQDEEIIYSVRNFTEIARSPTGCNGL